MELIKDVTGTSEKNIFADSKAITPLTKVITVLAGQKLEKGTILGVITVTKKCKMVDKDSTDGSEVAKYILSTDIDATVADIEALVYKRGYFISNNLVIADGDSVEAHEEELNNNSIYTTTAQ